MLFQILFRFQGFKDFKKFPIPDASVLHRFCQTVVHVAGGQGLQKVRINENALRLVESAGQILPAGQVHGHLAAYGAVDLGQNGGGYLEERNAPHIGSCRKAAQVPRHTAGQGDQRITAGHIELRQRVIHIRKDLHVLAGLAGRNGDDPHVEARLGQHLPDPFSIERLHMVIGNDGDFLRLREGPDFFAHPFQKAALDFNFIGIFSQIHFNCCHDASFPFFFCPPLPERQ